MIHLRFPQNVSLSGLLAAIVCLLAAATVPAQEALYGNYSSHDPSTMIKDGAKYFVYSDGQGISGLTSTNLRNWSTVSPVFTTPPAWTTSAISNFTGYFWAPDVAYFNGRYNLYYACSDWGTINSAIGLVTSPSLSSPVWTDRGKVIQSNPIWTTDTNTDLTAYNCIDPSIMVDTNGTVWMSFGSYSDGILIMQLDPTTGNRISANSPIYRVANNGPVFFSNTEEGSCLYQHGGYYYLFVNFGGCCAGVNSTYNIRVGRSVNVAGPYYDKSGDIMTTGGGTMVLESNARYIGPGHPGILYDNGTYWFTFHYYDGNNNGAAKLGLMKMNWTADGWPAVTSDWSAFYPFNADAREHLGLYNGTLQSRAAITNDASRGNVLNLDGVTNYVVLADPVANCSTLSAWVKWNGGGAWQRVFDFGSDTTNYFFLTPLAGNGKMRFAITTNSTGGEQLIDAATALPTGSWCHVAVTLDGSQGVLYLNGNPVGTNANITIRPWQILAKNDYVGKSQWAGDPLFGGRIDSFRIFGRALSGAEIKEIAYAQPSLAHRYSFTSNVWDSIGMAHGTLMGNAVVTNHALKLTGAAGGYANLPGGLASGSSALTVEFWAAFGVNASWARVFDFGNISGTSGQNFVFYSPHTAASGQRFGISTAAATVNFDPAGTLDNRAVHVVCILDPANSYCAIYTNAVLQSAVTNALPALTGVNSAWSFIGRSLFSADGWLNATIDELRIYDGRLTPQEIADDYAAGPDTDCQEVPLTMAMSSGGYSFYWPSYPPGFSLESSVSLGDSAVWNAVSGTPVITNGLYWQTSPATAGSAFFRLRR